MEENKFDIEQKGLKIDPETGAVNLDDTQDEFKMESSETVGKAAVKAETYVTKPFSGQATLDEPVWTTIVTLELILRKEILEQSPKRLE